MAETAELQHTERANAMYPDEPTPDPGSLPEPGVTPDPEMSADPEPEPELAPEPEPAPEPDPDPDPEPEPDPEPTGEAEVRTVEELAEHLETDQSWLEGLTISQTVRGEVVDVKIADALETHRKVESADSYLKEAKEKGAKMSEQFDAQQEALSTAGLSFGIAKQEKRRGS